MIINEEEDFVKFEMRGTRTDIKPNFINEFDTLKYFIQFLNQETNANNYRKLFQPSYIKTFEHEVWDRKLTQFHASFSTASRQYIGINNDFWQAPTRLFPFNKSSTFYIRFTHDGVNFFIPRHSQFIIELSFIFNYKKVKINL